MQIVIDIPKDIVESAKSSPNYYPTYHFEKIWKAIAKGIPLPKGHGDLIDRKDLTPDADYDDGIFGAVSCQQIVEAEAIIEADKAESEADT